MKRDFEAVCHDIPPIIGLIVTMRTVILDMFCDVERRKRRTRVKSGIALPLNRAIFCQNKPLA